MEAHSDASSTVRDLIALLAQRPAVAVLFSIVAIAVTTRFLFGGSTLHTKDGRPQPPPRPSYWLPFLGHGPQLLLNKDNFLDRMMKRYPEGIFSLHMLGGQHSVVSDPSLMGRLLNRMQTPAEEKWLAGRVVKGFGVRKQDQVLYQKIIHQTPELFKLMLSEPGLSRLVDTTVEQLKTNIADFVSFNSSPADQTDWEKLAGADVVQNAKAQSFVEAELMSLTRNFVATTANPSLFGTDFVQNFPDFFEILWKFDEGFLPLVAGVPGWVPWPSMQSAKVARRRLISYTREFEIAMDKYLDGQDPGVRWQDLDNVSEFLKKRIQVFKENGLSLEARASLDLSLAWAMNANANQLIAWMLFELYRDAVLLEQVREEVAPFIRIVQPPNDFGPAVWVAPELQHLDVEGLITKCPILKAAYWETLRVYTGFWNVKWLSEDVTLEAKDKNSGSSYLLKSGSYAHMAGELHQFDARYYPKPREWNHDRHLKDSVDEEGKSCQTMQIGTLRPYGKCIAYFPNFFYLQHPCTLLEWTLINEQPGGGASMCKGRAYALRELLVYVASILSFYDIIPPEGESWGEPKTTKRVGTRHAAGPVKVWIKKRQLATESEKQEA